MQIVQTLSFGRTMEAFSNKTVKAFLFNSAFPPNQAAIPFDPTDPLDCYRNCVAVAEGDFVVRDSKDIVIKQAGGRSGTNFKGSGGDPAQGGSANWLIPTELDTNRTISESNRFNFLGLLQIDTSGSNWADNTGIEVGDYLEYTYDYDVDVDGFEVDFTSTDSFGNFDIQVWDQSLNEGAGDWVVAGGSYDRSVTDRRETFAQTFVTRKVRVFFTGTSPSNFGINYFMPFSNNTAPVQNFPTTNPVAWALLVFNISGHPSQAVLGTQFPYVWMQTGSPLAPNDATVSSAEIKPGLPVKLVHAEFYSDIVGEI